MTDISNLGIGVMIHHLSGGSAHSSEEYVGKMITSCRLDNNKLRIEFEDGTKISIWDDGQSCCESRYMTTDDDPSSLVGQRWKHATAKDGPNMAGNPDTYDDTHETVFVEVATDEGFITLVNHNEHNGYYGGFGLTITENE